MRDQTQDIDFELVIDVTKAIDGELARQCKETPGCLNLGIVAIKAIQAMLDWSEKHQKHFN